MFFRFSISSSNFSIGYAPGINTNSPDSLSMITFPGVPLTPNKLLHSAVCFCTTSVYFPLSIHFSISFDFIPSSSAISNITS